MFLVTPVNEFAFIPAPHSFRLPTVSKMKKSFTILLFLSIPCFLIAQDTVKQKEIGLSFSGLDSFGLTFRIGTDKSLWRFNSLFIGASSYDQVADTVFNKQSNAGFGIQAGKEYRKLIVDKLELRWGVDLSFSYSKSIYNYNYGYDSRSRESTTYIPGIKFVLGLNYLLTSNLVIGAELLPGVSYTTGSSVETNYNIQGVVTSDISGFSYGLSNSSALLSLVYRF